MSKALCKLLKCSQIVGPSSLVTESADTPDPPQPGVQEGHSGGHASQNGGRGHTGGPRGHFNGGYSSNPSSAITTPVNTPGNKHKNISSKLFSSKKH